MQRTLGNRATVQALSGLAQVQRMATTAAALDPLVGGSKARPFGKGSTFATIQRVLARYEAASAGGGGPKQVALREKLLADLGRLCADYVNEHQRAATDQDRSRLAAVRQLADELPAEQVAITKARAEAKYLENINDRHSSGAFAAVDDSARVATKAVMDRFKGRLFAAESFNNTTEAKQINDRMALVDERGLSTAEDAAISAYSLGEYKYMNPATANKRTWMDEVKADDLGRGRGWDKLSNQTLREEGSLHAAMAMKGMAKLEPYTGLTYRGEERWDYEMRKKLVPGSIYEFTNLTSTSKMKSTALGFAGSGAPGKISVVWIVTNGGGRDISLLSHTQGEDEVLLLAGTKVRIKSAVRIDEQGGTDSTATDYPDMLSSLVVSAKAKKRKYVLVHAEGQPRADAKGGYDVADPAGGTMRFEKRPDAG